MAKLSVHGEEIGRIRYTTKIRVYFKDGKVLVNHGFGWKLAGKLKPGLTPQQAFDAAVKKQNDFLATHPALAAYRKLLHSITGIKNSWKLHAAIDLMPNDPDGVWSEACDGYGDNVSADVDDICKLCDLYGAAILEAKALKSEVTT